MRNSEDLNENSKNNWDYAGNCRNSEDVKINLKQQDNNTSGKTQIEIRRMEVDSRYLVVGCKYIQWI